MTVLTLNSDAKASFSIRTRNQRTDSASVFDTVEHVIILHSCTRYDVHSANRNGWKLSSVYIFRCRFCLWIWLDRTGNLERKGVKRLAAVFTIKPSGFNTNYILNIHMIKSDKKNHKHLQDIYCTVSVAQRKQTHQARVCEALQVWLV